MPKTFCIDNHWVGENYPSYFIADIAANHDGDLQRAKDLIYLAAEAGANAAKFQHFQAEKIVSNFGFNELGKQSSHQSRWHKSVFEVYQDASVPRNWTTELSETCKKAGIHFFSAPYDFEAVDLLDKVGTPAYKIGSGDITWLEMLRRIKLSNKPVFIASGASEMSDVIRAMNILTESKLPICLMQCNTNYTGSLENFRHIHLNVLQTYASIWPEILLGLSDHTPGHSTVLGAVALGARIIEKHFTDDKSRIGPDHAFSMNPSEWNEMMKRTRELEAALGSSQKFVAANETETVILQRRCLRADRFLPVGKVLDESDFVALRPAPPEAIMPYDANKIIGRTLKCEKVEGDFLTFFDFE
jgi:sialic acid synthase SpsE